MRYFSLLFVFFSSFVFSTEYKKIENEFQGQKIEYYQDTNKNIIDTSFKLKTGQDFEILYVFSYNCSTCYVFNEYIKEFEKYTKNNKIRFEKIPLYLGKNELNKSSAQTYFTRKFLRFNNDFDSLLFDLIHIKKVAINNSDAVKTLFTQYAKIKSEKLTTKEYEIKMKYRLERVKTLLNELNILTTPTIIIHKSGKRFMIDATTAGSPEHLLFTIFGIINLN